MPADKLVLSPLQIGLIVGVSTFVANCIVGIVAGICREVGKDGPGATSRHDCGHDDRDDGGYDRARGVGRDEREALGSFAEESPSRFGVSYSSLLGFQSLASRRQEDVDGHPESVLVNGNPSAPVEVGGVGREPETVKAGFVGSGLAAGVADSAEHLKGDGIHAGDCTTEGGHFGGQRMNRDTSHTDTMRKATIFFVALAINAAIYIPIFIRWGRAFSWVYSEK